MADIRFITNSKGEKVAAVIPMKDWKLLKASYRKLKAEEEDSAEAPKLKGKKALYIVRESPIHGRGVFAATKIKKGTPIIEYKGKHISSDEADQLASDDESGHHFTVLFSIDDDTVIDASQKGNDARFINHACDPNCEAVQYGRRVFIEAIKDIPEGAELTYDYHLQVEKPHTKKKLAQYVCHCGSKKCRGTQVDLS